MHASTYMFSGKAGTGKNQCHERSLWRARLDMWIVQRQKKTSNAKLPNRGDSQSQSM